MPIATHKQASRPECVSLKKIIPYLLPYLDVSPAKKLQWAITMFPVQAPDF
jgi:hypothetical protein